MGKKQEIHIGKLIKCELDKQGRKVEWLASQINCDVSNAYKILKRPNMDLYLILRILRVLNHNFLKDIS